MYARNVHFGNIPTSMFGVLLHYWYITVYYVVLLFITVITATTLLVEF
jgi:hypothetical protein